jgi:putative toxin-antitoxin system antitoxin component (TIGR02293 family)
MATNLNIAELIGFAPKSELELAEEVEKGLSTDTLKRLRDRGLTFTEIAGLIASPRTLKHRKSKGVDRLTHDEADRVVRVARILSLAGETFGEPQKALDWLRTPDDRLNNRSALSLLQTESGGRLVEEMLWQIREGIFS